MRFFASIAVLNYIALQISYTRVENLIKRVDARCAWLLPFASCFTVQETEFKVSRAPGLELLKRIIGLRRGQTSPQREG